MSNTTQKQIKWPEASSLPPGLYLVATPIGNLRDITLRALDVLSAVDAIACEDTRVSGKLLKTYDISKPLWSYNDHSDDKKRESIIKAIKDGKAVALISDAGSPLISDPGYKLVRDAFEAGISVTSIPGACAAIMALQLSGLPSEAFTFIGFLPPKEKGRRDALARWASHEETLITYESGPRLLSALKDIHAVLGDRKVCVARELTKMFEEIRFLPIEALIASYEEKSAPKGEIVLVIEGASARNWSDDEIIAALKEALSTMKTKDAAAHVMGLSGKPKKYIYDIALQLK